jgi:ABC-2 type transport system permease protein
MLPWGASRMSTLSSTNSVHMQSRSESKSVPSLSADRDRQQPPTPSKLMHWIGLKTLVARECGVIFRFWAVTLAPPVITTCLYFTIFGEIIGRRIGSIQGVAYIRYLAPGLVVLWVVPYAYSHTAAGFLGSRFFRHIEEVLVTPLPGWLVVMGYVLGGVIRGVLIGLIAMLVTILFTHLDVHSVLTSIAVVCLAATVSALAGFITALFASSFDQVTTIQAMILTPLMYVGGVFNPIASLPLWMQHLSLANPMFYVVGAFRYGVLGISEVNLGTALLIMCVSGSALFVAAVLLMSRGIGIRE